ncbi:MAG: hypothetical protein D6737_10165 [Chloroflexi bacterium]|nr:MAG: hypothetical protein D6737_10165 [Chloroflexota bacterium]
MSQNNLDPVRQRALGAILQRAVLRWETAFTIALTAALVVFFPRPFDVWQPWFWVVGGVLAELALIASTITDPEANAEAVAREFENKYDLRAISNPVSRERLQSALEYRRNMINLLARHKGAMRMHLRQTVADIDDWIAHMYNLAQHIDAFENNELVERDRQRVPQQLEKARTRLAAEHDEKVRDDLARQVQQLEQQLQSLDESASSAKRAEIQLESTLTALGTIYAQMTLLGTKEVDSSQAQRLRLEIQDEVASLQDTIDAMSEVQSQRLQLR